MLQMDPQGQSLLLTTTALLLSPTVCRRCPDHTQVHQGAPRPLLPRLPADASPAQPHRLPPAVHAGGPSEGGVRAPEQAAQTSDL